MGRRVTLRKWSRPIWMLVVVAAVVTGCDLFNNGFNSEIRITQGSTLINSGEAFDFGFVTVGSSIEVPFTISNPGTSPLDLTGDPPIEITGALADLFVVGTPPGTSIAPNGTSDFTLVFSPTSEGVVTTAIIILTNVLSLSTYTISVSGTGTAPPSPDISVANGTGDIASGGTHSFGTTTIDMASATETFTISNSGSADLVIDGTPRAYLSGTDANSFVIESLPASTVLSGGTTSFDVHYLPTAIGSHSAELIVENNDSDEDPYT